MPLSHESCITSRHNAYFDLLLTPHSSRSVSSSALLPHHPAGTAGNGVRPTRSPSQRTSSQDPSGRAMNRQQYRSGLSPRRLVSQCLSETITDRATVNRLGPTLALTAQSQRKTPPQHSRSIPHRLRAICGRSFNLSRANDHLRRLACLWITETAPGL